jgi:hypothetical protein
MRIRRVAPAERIALTPRLLEVAGEHLQLPKGSGKAVGVCPGGMSASKSVAGGGEVASGKSSFSEKEEVVCFQLLVELPGNGGPC